MQNVDTKYQDFLFIDCKEGRLLKQTTKPSQPGIVTTKRYLMKQKGPYKNYTEKMCRDSCKEFVHCSYYSFETHKVCQNILRNETTFPPIAIGGYLINAL